MTGKQIKTAALIVAAGRGTRTGSPLAKQYHNIGGASVLKHTLGAFENHDEIDHILTIIHPDDTAHYEDSAAGFAKCLDPVNGGASRQDSVRLGLQALENLNPDFVLIHDAARPFVTSGIISRVIDALGAHQGVIAALPVADTLKRVSDGLITQTCSRENLWRAQTPQGFHFKEIYHAHRAAFKQGITGLTDDASVAEWAGIAVGIVEGSEKNSKITSAEDLNLAEKNMQDNVEYRIGSGFDVHRFEAGDHITLCGVDIPHSHKLKGHSDADVALHALTDAVFGAIADGDIGSHFPPSDEKWAGAASHRFLRFAAERLSLHGGQIQNIDLTIICERPKIGPHREAMRENLGRILDLPVSRISIKATTTEKLGFAGREEGIAAQALANIKIYK